MSARGRLVKRKIYSALAKSKIKDQRKVKPRKVGVFKNASLVSVSPVPP